VTFDAVQPVNLRRRGPARPSSEARPACDIAVEPLPTRALAVRVSGELDSASGATLAMVIDQTEDVMVYLDLIDVVVAADGVAALVALYRQRAPNLRLLASPPLINAVLRAAASPTVDRHRRTDALARTTTDVTR
jgi:hypothetical protein